MGGAGGWRLWRAEAHGVLEGVRCKSGMWLEVEGRAWSCPCRGDGCASGWLRRVEDQTAGVEEVQALRSQGEGKIVKFPRSRWGGSEEGSVTTSYIFKDRGVTQGRGVVEG